MHAPKTEHEERGTVQHPPAAALGNRAHGHGGKRVSEPALATMRGAPLISVITVVYNGAAQLQSTIESALQLERDDLEYIVVDGGSTDGTLDVIRSYGKRLDYWISEPDGGIYDAMNKGIDLARGQFIHHLNIGDRMLRIPGLFDHPVPDDVMCIAAVVQTSPNGFHFPSAGMALRFHNTLHHQGCFYRKTPELRYDLRYKVFSDFDLNQRLLTSGARIVVCADIVAVHDADGISHTTDRFFEVYSIVQQNFGPWWVAICFMYFKYRGVLKRLRLS